MINFNHKLHWESPCEPGIIDISPGGLNMDVCWRHLFGVEEYIYPEVENSELIKIKSEYQGKRLIIIPILRKRWGYNSGLFGWTELIDYQGLDVYGGKIFPLKDKNRMVIIYELSDLKNLYPEEIEKLLTIKCTISNYFKIKDGKKVYQPNRKDITKILPLYFLMEGVNGKFGVVNLWKPNYIKPEIVFGTKKELILDLRNPEIEIWLTKTHSSKIKDFLFK